MKKGVIAMDYGNIAQSMVNSKEVKDTNSNVITLYHGSIKEVGQPIFGKGKAENDYGRGFYLTEDMDLAKEWAALYGAPGRCYLNTYQLDISCLNIFRFNDEDHLQWLAVLLKHRKCGQIEDVDTEQVIDALDKLYAKKYVDLSKYDCVIGWRADDSYFSYVSDYVLGLTTKQKFIRAIKYGDLGEQFVLLSKESFDRIKYIGSEKLNYNIWRRKATERDNKARNAYRVARAIGPKPDINQFIEEVRLL